MALPRSRWRLFMRHLIHEALHNAVTNGWDVMDAIEHSFPEMRRSGWPYRAWRIERDVLFARLADEGEAV